MTGTETCSPRHSPGLGPGAGPDRDRPAALLMMRSARRPPSCGTVPGGSCFAVDDGAQVDVAGLGAGRRRDGAARRGRPWFNGLFRPPRAGPFRARTPLADTALVGRGASATDGMQDNIVAAMLALPLKAFLDLAGPSLSSGAWRVGVPTCLAALRPGVGRGRGISARLGPRRLPGGTRRGDNRPGRSALGRGPKRLAGTPSVLLAPLGGWTAAQLSWLAGPASRGRRARDHAPGASVVPAAPGRPRPGVLREAAGLGFGTGRGVAVAAGVPGSAPGRPRGAPAALADVAGGNAGGVSRRALAGTGSCTSGGCGRTLRATRCHRGST